MKVEKWSSVKGLTAQNYCKTKLSVVALPKLILIVRKFLITFYHFHI